MRNVLLAIGLLLVVCGAAIAQEGIPAAPAATTPTAPQQGWQYTLFTKLGRGIGNIVLAPIEIPVTAFNVCAETDVAVGLTAGVIAGIAACVERKVAGAVDIVTFLFPPYDRPIITWELGKSPAAGGAVSTFPKEF